jgi:hypothetical protein
MVVLHQLDHNKVEVVDVGVAVVTVVVVVINHHDNNQQPSSLGPLFVDSKVPDMKQCIVS